MGGATAAAEAGIQPGVVGLARLILAAAFVVAVPLLVISTTLRWLVTDRDLMLTGFREARVDLTTGLSQPQLEGVAQAFVDYFLSPPGRLEVEVEIGGQRRPLFNERELAHMEDVQALVQVFLRLQWVALAVVLARAAFALAVQRSGRGVGTELLWSAGLVVALVVVIVAVSLVDFAWLWTRFHQVAFRNDLWLLDPRTDYLIMLFPQPTWFAYTIRMVGGVAGGMALAAVLGLILRRVG